MSSLRYQITEGTFNVFIEGTRSVSTIDIENENKYFSSKSLPAAILMILEDRKEATKEEIQELCLQHCSSEKLSGALDKSIEILLEKKLIRTV